MGIWWKLRFLCEVTNFSLLHIKSVNAWWANWWPVFHLYKRQQCFEKCLGNKVNATKCIFFPSSLSGILSTYISSFHLAESWPSKLLSWKMRGEIQFPGSIKLTKSIRGTGLNQSLYLLSLGLGGNTNYYSLPTCSWEGQTSALFSQTVNWSYCRKPYLFSSFLCFSFCLFLSFLFFFSFLLGFFLQSHLLFGSQFCSNLKEIKETRIAGQNFHMQGKV